MTTPHEAPQWAGTIGLKTGVFPPLLAAAEVTFQWTFAGQRAAMGLGTFGCYSPVGIGDGHHRMLAGTEIVFTDDIARSAVIVELSYAYYHAWPDAAGREESSHILAGVGGYGWRWGPLQLYAAGGVGLYLLGHAAGCTDQCKALDTRFYPMLTTGIRYVF